MFAQHRQYMAGEAQSLLSFEQALYKVQEARPRANPNKGFRVQLQKYEKTLKFKR